MTAIRAPSGAQAKASTSIPASVRTVGRGGRGSFAGRPRRGHRRVDQPDLGPAATSRQEGDPVAVGRPARLATAPRSGDDPRQARPVDLDDPDLLIADVREPAAVGRPLRVGHGLVRGGQLGRIAAAQRDREQLARAGGLGGVGDHPVARVEPELARDVDRDDRLDRQARRGCRRRRRHQRRSPVSELARAPRAEHREVLADVAVEAVVGPAPAVGRAQVVRGQATDGLEQRGPRPVVAVERRRRCPSLGSGRPSARSRRRSLRPGRPASSRAARTPRPPGRPPPPNRRGA